MKNKENESSFGRWLLSVAAVGSRVKTPIFSIKAQLDMFKENEKQETPIVSSERYSAFLLNLSENLFSIRTSTSFFSLKLCFSKKRDWF